MAKYKVGDKVRVIINGELYKTYWMEGKSGRNSMVESMLKFGGKVVTITKASDTGYSVSECPGWGWVDEMFEGLAEEEPKPKSTYKVKCVGYKKTEKCFTIGKVYEVKDNCITNDNGYTYKGGCGNEKDVIKWLSRWYEFEVVEEQPTPTPTPVVNLNVTVNLYENACWYCRKGGLVDLYLAGAMGICPSCGRVCNNVVPTPKKEIVIEFKPRKKNKPLTKEELDALPNGTKVYIVWRWDMDSDSKKEPVWDESGWGVKKGESCRWSYEGCEKAWQSIDTYDRCFDAYLEEPERPS